jgi:hypothetical protein
MNRKIGLYSSIAVAVTTAMFALGLIFDNNNFSYFASMLISWSYIMLACSFAAGVSGERKALAYGGVAFACVYAVFVDLVYFTQLTTVANNGAPAEILKVLSYESLGGFMFNLDLLGYALMAISTFLIGLTVTPQNKPDKWLKALLMIHGVFALSCIIMPMLNIFNSSMGDSGAIIGSLVLLFWCAYFIPVGILSALHFNRSKIS